MDTTNSFEIPYVDPGDPQRDFPPLNKQAMEIIDAALFEQAGAIQDLDAAIGTTETAITTALAGKVTGTGMTVRVDTSVGTRVLLDHPGGTTMLSGDTGWRDITGLLTAGFELASPTSEFTARRENSVAWIQGRIKVAATAPFIGQPLGSVDILQLPPSLSPRTSYIPAVGHCLIAGTPAHMRVGDGRGLRVVAGTGTWASGTIIEMALVHLTTTAWPTTPFGTP